MDFEDIVSTIKNMGEDIIYWTLFFFDIECGMKY